MNRNRQPDMIPDARTSRMRRMALSWLLVVILLLGSSLPAGATTGHSDSERTPERKIITSDRIHPGNPDTEDPIRQETPQAPHRETPQAPPVKSNAVSLKQAKQIMNQKLTASNRLSQEIGVMKKKAAKLVETARNRIKQILKNSENLSGEQIVALKDVVSQLKQYRDNVEAQERLVTEILERLHDLRSEEQYADSVTVLDELIAAQKKMVEIMKGSGTAVAHIGTILKS
jgi:plasmid maintenance system antidote protein VapI